MNTDLYRECLENIRFYKNTIPNISDIIKVKLIKYHDSYIECFCEEYKNIVNLDYKNATNIKKLKNIKKYFDSLDNFYLIVTNVNGDFIEVSHQTLDDTDIKLFENFLNVYNVIRVNFIKFFIFHQNNINFTQVLDFINDTLWKLDINSKNIDFHLNKFYENCSYFTDTIDYTWNNDTKDDIDNSLKKYITKPYKKVRFIFTINSFDIRAIQSIIDTVHQFNKMFDCELEFIKTPEYQLIYELKDNDKLDDNIQKKINEFKSFSPFNIHTQLKLKTYNILI